MSTLIEIGEEALAYAALLEGAVDDQGEFKDDEQARILDDWFREIVRDQSAKLDGYCALIRDAELRAAARREESERLRMRVSVDENFARRLKDRLKVYLQITAQRRIDTRRYKITLNNNGGKAPVRVDVPPEMLPLDLQVRTVVANADAIRAKLEKGEAVEGCELGERGQHVRIT